MRTEIEDKYALDFALYVVIDRLSDIRCSEEYNDESEVISLTMSQLREVIEEFNKYKDVD